MSIQIQKVTDKSFRKYGRILTGEYDVAELMDAMEKTECPDYAVIYIPSDKEIEKLPVMKAFTDSLYGGLPIQIGYCNGNNHLLNAVEYHRSSEVNVACTDLILLIGSEQDIEDDYTYDTSKIEAFLLPKGTVAEVYATTLHYAPCGIDGKGFQVAVVLPKGTNYPLKSKHIRIDNKTASTSNKNTGSSNINEDALLAAANKWLIGHAEGGLDDSAYIGLKGENIEI